MRLSIAGAFVAIFLVGVGLSTLGTNTFPRFFIVESGSMSPALSAGTLVLSKQSKTYNVGDIITFVRPSTTGESVTHRIVNKAPNAQFITKGDANSTADLSLVDRGHIIGKAIFSVPYLGFILSFARSLPGLLLFLFLPAGLFILGEMQTMYREIKRLMQIKRNIIQPFTL